MTHGQHGAGVREEPANQRQPHHVERVLVHQALPALHFDLAADLLPVMRANLLKLRGAQLAQLGRVAHTAAASVIERALEKWSFVHGPEVRMGIEDLLEERRAGARKGDDEDRTVLDSRRLAVVPGGDILRIAAGAGEIHCRRAFARLPAERRREEGDLRVMCFLERRVRLVPALQRIERLGEREQQVVSPQEVVLVLEDQGQQPTGFLVGATSLGQERLGQHQIRIAAVGKRIALDAL